MIKSFGCRETRRVFERQRTSKFLAFERIALRKLLQIEVAGRIEDLKVPPGNRLEKLSGNRSGQYSSRINDQWRICFHWIDGNAFDVEIVDYH